MALTLKSEKRNGLIGEVLSLPIKINADVSYTMTALGFKLAYDPRYLQYRGIIAGGLIGGWIVSGFENRPGSITIGAYAGAAKEIVDESTGTLVEIQLEVVAVGQTEFAIYEYVDDLLQFEPMPMTDKINEEKNVATRKEIQIAQDIIKFTNIMNDLLDCLSWQLQAIDPNNGGLFEITISGGMGEPQVKREPTVDELKAMVTRTIANVMGYRNTMKNYLQKIDISKVINGLNALGVDVVIVQQEIADMKVVCDYLTTNLPSATTKAHMVIAGQYIDANVDKLELVRRDWAI